MAKKIKIYNDKKWSNNKLSDNNKDNRHKKEVITFFYISVQVLENSGILDAYEYFLRAICKNGLP